MTLPCTTQEDGGNTQWCQARGQEAMSRNWRTKGSTQTCPYCVGQINHRGKNFPLWRYPKAVWTHSWLMCHRAPCLSREVGLDGPFPPYWFCVIILGPKMFLPQEEGLAPSICFHWNCSSGFKSEFKLRIPPLEYSQDRQHGYCQPQSKQLAHSSRAYLCTSYFGTLYSPCLSVDPAVILQFVFEEIERCSLTSLDQIFNRNSCWRKAD